MPEISSVSVDIEERLRDGEQVNVQELARHYFPGDTLEVARHKIYGRIVNIKRHLAEEQITVCMTSPGLIGIPQNKEQVEYGMFTLKRRVESNVANYLMLHSYGKSQSILPEGMRNKTIMLPVFHND